MESPEKQSPYYRVSCRAIILTPDNKVVLVEDREGELQLPGGGWEHTESFEDSIRREVREELGVGVKNVGRILFAYRQHDRRGFTALRLAAKVTPDGYDFVAGDDMVNFHLVSKKEFLRIKLCPGEGPVQDFADIIWGDN